MQMNELPEIKVHNNQQRVMGISVDSTINHMFSISESGYLIVSDLNSQEPGGKYINSQNLSKKGLKAMIHDHQRNVLFIATGEGKVIILNSIPTNPVVLTTIETDKPCCIRGLSRSINCGGFWLASNRPGSKAGLT